MRAVFEQPKGAEPFLADVVPPEVEVSDHYEDRSTWSTFHRIAYRVRGLKGTWVLQEREFLDRGDAVALLPYCAATGNVLLTRQFRMPVFVKRPEESRLVEVCGGILDAADPAVTALHEASEELGIELPEVHRVFEGYSTPGSVCEKVTFFLAPYSPEQRKTEGGGKADEGEDIEVIEMPLRQALAMIRRADIRDLRTIALLLYLAVFQSEFAREKIAL